MFRRQFIQTAGSAALAAAAMPGNSKTAVSTHRSNVHTEDFRDLKAIDINNHLRSLIEVNEPSVDKIIIGDPNTPVSKIGTCWMPYFKTLRLAAAQGVNTLVVHEPTFYVHRDLDEKLRQPSGYPEATDQAYARMKKDKAKWITDQGMVIIRCHDVWDILPDIGIPFAFGQALGFEEKNIIRSRPYYNVYTVDPVPASKMAEIIASRLKLVGQPGVAFYGDADFMVRSVGVGTGCASNPLDFMDLNPDLYIAIDDSVQTWVQTTYAEDSGQPLVVINHGTSEEFGMLALNRHLKETFSGFDVLHFEQGCGYRWVTA